MVLGILFEVDIREASHWQMGVNLCCGTATSHGHPPPGIKRYRLALKPCFAFRYSSWMPVLQGILNTLPKQRLSEGWFYHLAGL